MIGFLKKGNKITLDKHYFKKHKKAYKKFYPSFSLVGFSKAYDKYIAGNKQSKAVVKKFDPEWVRCKKNGKRVAVWINTDHGTYALNGTAISWFQKTKKIGKPLVGSDGKDWKIGRNDIDPSLNSSLIDVGLKKCGVR
ncbi:MAG: hypothetical protein ACTSXQ_01970 [Alphaproteobacteria bacterium]